MFSLNRCGINGGRIINQRRKETSELKSENSHQLLWKREKQKYPSQTPTPLFSPNCLFLICSCAKVYLGFTTNFSFSLEPTKYWVCAKHGSFKKNNNDSHQREGGGRKEKENKEIWHKGNGPNEDKATHLTHLESEAGQQGALSQSPGCAVRRRVRMGSFGRGVCFINLTVQLWKLSGSSHVSCHSVEIGCWSVGWGEWWGVEVEGEEGGWGVEGGTGSGGRWNHTGIYFKCIYKTKWGKKPSVFLLGHVREPLAKIIIYKEGEREEEREGGRERQRLSIIRDTGEAHWGSWKIKLSIISADPIAMVTGQRKILINPSLFRWMCLKKYNKYKYICIPSLLLCLNAGCQPLHHLRVETNALFKKSCLLEEAYVSYGRRGRDGGTDHSLTFSLPGFFPYHPLQWWTRTYGLIASEGLFVSLFLGAPSTTSHPCALT